MTLRPLVRPLVRGPIRLPTTRGGGAPLDSTVATWAAAVTAAGGTFLGGALGAINNMVVGLKADGTWAKITDMHIFGGIDTLAGVLVPLKTSAGISALTFTNGLQTDYIPTGADFGINDYDNARYSIAAGTGSATLKTLHIGAPVLQTLSAYGTWGSSRNNVPIFQTTTGQHPQIYPNSETTVGASLYSFAGSDFAFGAARFAGDQIGVRTSASAAALHVNGTQIATASGASATVPGTGNVLLLSNSASQTGLKRISAFFVAPSASSAEALSIRARVNAALLGIGYSLGIKTHLFVGDSITQGFNGATPYSTPLKSAAGFTGARYVNIGKSSAAVTNINAVYTTIATPLRPDTFYSTKGIAYVMAGTNDLAASVTAATTLTNLRTLWASLRTDGFKVVAGTIPNRADVPWTGAMETERLSLNTSILADSANWDAVVPWHTLLPDANNASLFQADKLHPNTAGEAVVASWIAANINPATI